jgi:hypothetical protein
VLLLVEEEEEEIHEKKRFSVPNPGQDEGGEREK